MFLHISVVEPINSTTHLRLNTKPEADNYSLPKLLLDLMFEEIAIVINRKQVTF